MMRERHELMRMGPGSLKVRLRVSCNHLTLERAANEFANPFVTYRSLALRYQLAARPDE
jgi:hypothetical protein